MARHLPVVEMRSSVRSDGTRQIVHPADVAGRFNTARRVAFWVLLAVYALVPWVNIGGHPAVLLDLQHRRFYLLGAVFNAQDVWLVFFLLTGIGFALTLAIFYPGIMNYDARYVYLDAQRGFYGDWQSPVMTLLWKLIDPAAPGPASMFLLIAALYWLSFALLATALARRSLALACAAPLVALTPPLFALVGVIWRDVLMAACWLVATPDGRYAFTTNAGSNSISTYEVGPRGALTLIHAATPSGGLHPIDEAVTSDGDLLYVLDNTSGQIAGFRIERDGALTPAGVVSGLLRSSVGLVAR